MPANSMAPLKLFPARDKLVSWSSFEIWGETEPYRLKSVRSNEETRPREQWIPTQEQTELGFDKFHVFNTGSGNSNPRLSETKTRKSSTKEEWQVVLRRENRVKTMKGTMFCWQDFSARFVFGRTWRKGWRDLRSREIIEFLQKEGKVKGIWKTSSACLGLRNQTSSQKESSNTRKKLGLSFLCSSFLFISFSLAFFPFLLKKKKGKRRGEDWNSSEILLFKLLLCLN